MAHLLITSVRKADRILTNANLTGNFNIFAQLSSHPPKGFNKLHSQRNGNKSYTCNACGPGSDGKNKRKILNGIQGSLGAGWVYLNYKDLNSKDFVDNFLRWRTNLDQLVNAAKSTDPQIQYGAVYSVRKLLTSGRNPPIDFLISCNILPTLVECLSSQNRVLQVDALWALTNIAAGTSEQAQAVVEAGAVPQFLRLLTAPHPSVRKFALAALDYLILKGPKLRDRVINLEVVVSLLNCIQPDTPRNFQHKVLRMTARTLKLFTDDGGKKQIQMIIDRRLLPKLVQSLNHGKVKVQIPALIAVYNIVNNGSNDQVQAVLNCDALSHFHNLLNHPNKNICEMALLTLSKVAAKNFTRVQAVIDAGLVPHIVQHLEKLSLCEPLEKGAFQAQKAAAYALSAMTMSGTKKQVEHLIDCGVIPLFINVLNCKDSEVVHEVLVGIHDILEKLSINQGSGDKACTLIEECGGWDKIKALQNHESMNICKIAHDIVLKFSLDHV